MKVGIIGCGNIADSHLPHILRHTSVENVSVADIASEKADAVAKKFGLKQLYTDLDMMLAEQKPDVVHVLTPPALHASQAIKSMEAGCHVLVEKPMTLTLEEANAVVTTARNCKVKLCVDHNYLWQPGMIRAWQLAEEGMAGKVLHVDINYSYDRSRFRLDHGVGSTRADWILRLPGGPMADLLPHPLSILIPFLGENYKVFAIGKCYGVFPGGLPDELRVLINARDLTGSITLSTGIQPDSFLVNLYGMRMTIQVNLSNMTIVVRKNRKVPKKISKFVDNLDQARQIFSSTSSSVVKLFLGKAQPPGDVGLLIAEFYRSIVENREPPVSGENGKALVKLSNEIWRQVVGEG